jgi:hypothetical protein
VFTDSGGGLDLSPVVKVTFLSSGYFFPNQQVRGKDLFGEMQVVARD